MNVDGYKTKGLLVTPLSLLYTVFHRPAGTPRAEIALQLGKVYDVSVIASLPRVILLMSHLAGEMRMLEYAIADHDWPSKLRLARRTLQPMISSETWSFSPESSV